jgi:ComF family protein
MNLKSLIYDLIAKNRCLICRKNTTNGKQVCTECHLEITNNLKPKIGFLPVLAAKVIGPEQNAEIPVLYGSRYKGNPKLSQAIRNLKFRNRKHLAGYLAKIYYEILYQLCPMLIATESISILPVPIHYLKKCTRGYNHIELIARSLAKFCQLDLCLAVAKTRYTKEQITLKRSDRNDNLHASFALSKKPKKPPDYLLILDDVVTTGATIRELISCLKPWITDIERRAIVLCLVR